MWNDKDKDTNKAVEMQRTPRCLPRLLAPGAQRHHVMYVGTYFVQSFILFFFFLTCFVVSLSETDGLIFYVSCMSEQGFFFFLLVISWIDNICKDIFLSEEWERRNRIRGKLGVTGKRQERRQWLHLEGGKIDYPGVFLKKHSQYIIIVMCSSVTMHE